MSHDHCHTGSKWNDKPVGKETVLANRPTYVTGSNNDAAVLVIHDLFGWTFANIRLLADVYATQANATVFVPDFFGGEVLPTEILKKDPSEWGELDIPSFVSRNSKQIREPEIVACAKVLKGQYGRCAAVGFCYGGWACARLGAQSLVDCISFAHPSLLTKEEIETIKVPTQIIAAEIDQAFTPDLRDFSNSKIPSAGIAYDFQFFPGLAHGFAVRSNVENNLNERKGLERAKNAMVHWLNQWLHE